MSSIHGFVVVRLIVVISLILCWLVKSVYPHLTELLSGHWGTHMNTNTPPTIILQNICETDHYQTPNITEQSTNKTSKIVEIYFIAMQMLADWNMKVKHPVRLSIWPIRLYIHTFRPPINCIANAKITSAVTAVRLWFDLLCSTLIS